MEYDKKTCLCQIMITSLTFFLDKISIPDEMVASLSHSICLSIQNKFNINDNRTYCTYYLCLLSKLDLYTYFCLRYQNASNFVSSFSMNKNFKFESRDTVAPFHLSMIRIYVQYFQYAFSSVIFLSP